MNAEIASKKKINLRKVLLDALSNNSIIKNRFQNASLSDKIYGWELPTGESKTKIYESNFLLIGDAAS